MKTTALFSALLLTAGLLVGCGQAPTVAVAPTGMAADAGFEAERAYAIENTLGIGPTYGEKLRKAGVSNTQKLLDQTASRRARQALAEKAEIPYKRVLGWAQQAELMKIAGIGPRQANLLAAVGVASVKELAQRKPENLTERVGVANSFSPRFVDRTPSLATVTKWIAAAKEMPSAISDDK
jgi:predicted flap endonuclease-1-like 5' DNA nuclease